MKKSGIIHARLGGLIAGLGHFDTFVISDAGLPMPKGVEVVDLAVVGGLPSFCDVVAAIMQEVCVEEYTIASEMTAQPHDVLARMQKLLPDSVLMNKVPQEEFNRLAKDAKFVVRTGEFSHYANVLIRCGCSF